MIQYRNVDNWKLINYQGHDIKGVYSSLGKVWPTIPSVYKWLATYNGGSVSYADCDGTSAITSGEVATTNLVAVSIGDCVTSLGDYAFLSCSSLSAITIPDNVTNMGDFTFGFCSSLTSVDIPSGVTSIGNNTFQGAGLTSITIPNSVTSIGVSAFFSCYNLTSATIGNGVTSLGNSVFASCRSLSAITIPDSVASIGDYAFNRCSGLTKITVEATVPATLGTSAFDETNDCPIYVPCQSLAAYQTAWSTYANRLQCIPTPTYNRKWFATLSGDVITSGECNSSSSLTAVEILARTNLSVDDIYSVEIGDCVTTLPNSFLNSADRLSSCTIPSTVTSIGTQAFYYCKNLKRINSNVDGVFNIPSGITSISDSTFNTCTGLTNVTMPNTITSIGVTAFKGCTNLSSMTIPNSVTSIGAEAFRECTSLPSITIPDSVQTIGNMAFGYCSGATACTIGSGLTSLPDGTFYLCSGITTFTVNSNAVVSDDYSGKGKIVDFTGSNVKDLIIGEGVTSIGKWAFGNCVTLLSVSIPSSLTTIGERSFYVCTGLSSVTIPSGVTSIGDRAFYNCNGLTGVTVEATTPPALGSNVFDVTNDCPIYVPCGSLAAYQTAWSAYANRLQCIPTPAFDGKWKATKLGGSVISAECDATSAITASEFLTNRAYLVDVEIGDCVTSIGNSAISSCSALTSVTIGSNVATIGNGAFQSNKNLTSIDIPNSVTSIGESFLFNCSGLTSCTIGSGVTSIGQSAFYGCAKLSSVTIPDSVTTIGNNLFRNCSGLTSVTLSSGITAINNYTFSGCYRLPSLTIPNGVTEIGNFAFQWCSGMTSIDIPDSVTSIGDSSFYRCTSLTSATIGSGVTSIGQTVFSYCNRLSGITVNATTPPTLGFAAFDSTNNCPIYVPCQSLAAYQTAWSSYSSRIQCIPTPSYKWLVTYSDSHTESAECDSTSAITYGEVNLQGLYEVQIGDCVTSIDQYAFGDSTAITSITIGSGVTSIGAYAFMNSNNIQSITIKATTPPSIGELVFGTGGGTSDNCPIYVPSQSVSAYQSAWSSYSSRIQAIP